MYKEIHLELTTLCNFQCDFCPLAQITRTKKNIPQEEAFKIIKEISEHKLTRQIAYHLMGEPLLHPNLGDILLFSAKMGMRNRIVTNGFLLSNEGYFNKLQNCDILDISIRALNQLDYSSMNRNKEASYDDYIKGIKNFLININKNMQVRLRMFSHDHTQEILENLGFKFELKSLREKNTDKRMIILRDNIGLILEHKLDWKGKTKRYPSKMFGHCTEFHEGFSILVNGDITPCCWDYNGLNSLGNIFNDGGIVNILSKKLAREFLASFDRRKIPTKFCSECLGKSTRLKSFLYQGIHFLRGQVK